MLRRTPRAVSHARLNGFDFADPSRLRLEEPCPDLNRPLTSHVTTTARALRLRPTSSLATRTVFRRPECFTAAARSVRYPSGKGRPVTTPRRLLPYRARCLATPLKLECGFDPANRASRVRSPRPPRHPSSQGRAIAPWLDRASNAVPAWLAAMLHDDRFRSSTRDACDQLSANDTSTTGTHVSLGDPQELSPRGVLGMHGAFHDAPRTSDVSVFDSLFEAGVSSSRDVDRASIL